jgi:hypothetical protein
MDPLEVMYSSANAKENSGDEEKASIWKKYIDQHRIDVHELPRGTSRLHSGNHHSTNSKLVRTEGRMTEVRRGDPTSTKKPKKIGTKPKKIRTLIGKKRKDQGNEEHHTVDAQRRKTKVTSVETRAKETLTNVRFSEEVLRESKETTLVPLHLHRDAMNALKQRYGNNVPEIEGFGATYKKLGFVWKHHLRDSNQTSWDLGVEYPPSVLDMTSITLPNSNGKGWTKKKDSNQALFWWIICNVPSVRARREWARAKLKDNTYAVLLEERRMWCTISRHSNGSFWVEFNGRQMELA